MYLESIFQKKDDTGVSPYLEQLFKLLYSTPFFSSPLFLHFWSIFISFFSNGTAEETEFLNSDHVKKLENELETLMKKPGYFGLTESIEWVLKVARDSSNTFEDCDNFLSYVVCDNLFTEKYHNLT